MIRIRVSYWSRLSGQLVLCMVSRFGHEDIKLVLNSTLFIMHDWRLIQDSHWRYALTLSIIRLVIMGIINVSKIVRRGSCKRALFSFLLWHLRLFKNGRVMKIISKSRICTTRSIQYGNRKVKYSNLCFIRTLRFMYNVLGDFTCMRTRFIITNDRGNVDTL